MSYSSRMKEKLENNLSPCEIKLVDDSHKHQGHAGAHPEGETHFSLTLISDQFEGINRIERHQKIYTLLDTELKEHVHALQLKTLTFSESRNLGS